MSRVVVVTGTDTGVGKTVAAAALAVRAESWGSVTVVKPVQTGAGSGEPTDAAEVHRLTGCTTEELTSLEHPVAPDTAARLVGARLPGVASYAARVRALTAHVDTVVVEGAGGLLVRLDTDGGSLLDLAATLSGAPRSEPALELSVVVVVRAGLGTLNHTELTVAALRSRGLEPAALVIGSWPDDPGLAERCNLADLPAHTGVPLWARIPAGAGRLDRAAFRAAAPGWFTGPEPAAR